MPSRRRSRSKNLGTNLAEVQRRLRYLERRPVRTKLQRNVVTTSAIAVNAVTPDEVSFGTTIITDEPTASIENPKDGLLVVNETAGTTSVYSEQQNTYIQLPAVDDEARTVALGKNTIYYQTSAPSGGSYSVDDTWFDTDDGYKMYTWTGSTWSGFQLGNSAIANISAAKITAGSLAANVIVTSSIAAGQISAGSLSSGVIVTSNLSANQITSGTITGILIRTSSSGRRIEITDQDDLIFYDTDSRVGTITAIAENWDPGEDGTIIINDGIMIYGGPDSVGQGAAKYPSIVATDSGISIFGSSTSYMEYDSTSVRTYGPALISYADVISLSSGWNGGGWYVEIFGPLVLGEDPDEGPLSNGTGQPPTNGHTNGQIVFRYT